MIYTVKIKETLVREIQIGANNPSEALNTAQKMYDNGEIILDSTDHVGTSILVVDNDVA